jgi:hypothetical protein
MKKTVFYLSTLGSLLAAACAGQLSEEDQIRLFNEHTGGSGGSGGTPTTTTTTGSGGSGPAVDMCVVSTTALKSCQAAGCHSPPLSANLDLTAASVTTNAKSFLDKANAGSDMACMPGMGKLIDSANAMNSLLYTKLQATGETITPPCGSKMPVIGNFSMADKACILSWINSVIMLK